MRTRWHSVLYRSKRHIPAMDRFFIHDFFAFCKEKSWGDFGIGSGKIVFTKIESGAHDLSSVEGCSPSPASGDFGNQAVCVETAKDPGYFGAGSFLILAARTQVPSRLKLASDIPIGETSQAMLSVHDCLE